MQRASRPRRLRIARAAGALVLTLGVLVAYGAWRNTPVFEAIEGQTLTWRFQLRGPLKPGRDVAVIAIDDRSVAALGGWPVDRGRLAKAVDALSRAGASVIVFDLLFAGPGRKEASAAGDGDAKLAAAMRRAGNVVVPFAFVFHASEASGPQHGAALRRAAYASYRLPAGAAAGSRVRPAGVVAPPETLLAAGTPAHVTVVLDSDGALRWAQPAIRYGDAYYPSLAIEAVRLYRHLPRNAVALTVGQGIALGDRFVATDRHMRLAINYYGGEGVFPRYSLIDLLDGKLPAGALKGRIVVVGASAVGVGDRFVTPFTRRLPGFAHFATVIDNILTGRSLRRGDMAALADIAAIVVAGLTGWALGRLRRPWLATAGAAVLALTWAGIALAAFAYARLWLNVTFPVLAFALVAGFSAIYALYAEGRLRRSAEADRSSLARFVSPLAAEQALGGGATTERTIEATIMFVDIRGFTGLGETMTPEESMRFLRSYHRIVERAVERHHGTIDKFIGDGVLITFGAPAGDPAAPCDALACARTLVGDLAGWRDGLMADGRPAPRVGIGLHHGPVTLGVAGGEHHAEVTVTGDTVNVASRLEGLTKEHAATAIASEAVIAAARAVGRAELIAGFEPLAEQPIRGRAGTLRVWAWRGPQTQPPE
jgi:adenylate cyclase